MCTEPLVSGHGTPTDGSTRGLSRVDVSATDPRLRDPGHIVGGLDGCRGGWVLATLGPDELTVRVVATFAEVVDRVEDGVLAALAVDMPIGLPDRGPRRADTEARRRLGVRRSSVFPTPVRAALDAVDYPDALAISRRVSGKGLSKQAFNLLRRMAEVDRAMTPALQDRIFECHPELAFAELAGATLVHSKHTRPGIDERLDLLARSLGPHQGRHLTRAAGAAGPGARPDDVVDAVVIALVADAVAAGRPEAVRLGDGTRDRRGLRMEIVTRSPAGPPEAERGQVEVP
jgi:predicted RNase H-like nuclease